jgi:hypothetical protein
VARREELAANLAAVERRLAAACQAAGRARSEVTLIAVTKTFPVSDIRLLASLGVTDIAENRDQEARAKAAEAAHLPDCADLRWHFVGQLQRNKARSVVSYADVVHSVDRMELVGALAEAAAKRRDTPLDVLLQVNLDAYQLGDASGGRGDVTSVTLSPAPAGAAPRLAAPGDPGSKAGAAPASAVAGGGTAPVPLGPRGGSAPGELSELAAAVAAEPALRLRGVMAVAPPGRDPDAAFAALAGLSAELTRAYPGARWISAGMSGDLESAIGHGATHVRVGSALLGNRSR